MRFHTCRLNFHGNLLTKNTARWTAAVLTLAAAAWLAASWAAPGGGPLIIGEHRRDKVLETPHPYPNSSSGRPEMVWSDHYYYPGAAYLVVEFKKFDLAPGDWVEVLDLEGKQVQRFEDKGFLGMGGDFITKMVFGEDVVINLWSVNTRERRYGYRVERITRGYNDKELEMLYGGDPMLEAVCGTANARDAKCYETSQPQVYNKSKAVTRIVMDGSALCTGWLVSCNNHMFTNNHCTWDADGQFNSQGELNRMEHQFMYEDTSCGGKSATVGSSFMGGTYIKTNATLDYTLFQAPAGQDPQASYGFLAIDNRLPNIDEQMYIPGHPAGRPKEIAIESTHANDQSGICEVYSTNEPPCAGGGGDIGYFCDTEGGNSGSPVVSLVTHGVIALHHCANCPNRGVRITEVYADAKSSLPACSLLLAPNLSYSSHTITDTPGGNNDGIVDPGETVTMPVTLLNSGNASATSISGTLSTATSGITVTTSKATWANIAAGKSAVSNSPHFAFSVGSGVACGSKINFNLDIVSAEGSYKSAFEVLVGKATISGTTNYKSTDTPLAINDSKTITSNLTVSGTGNAYDVICNVNISHTWIGDLIVDLKNPSGTTVRLHNQGGGSADDIKTSYDSLTAPSGPGVMNDFDGQPVNGVWQLVVSDNAKGDTGTLNSWSLDIKTATYTCTTACNNPTFGGAQSVTDLDACADTGVQLAWNAPSAWGGAAGTYEVRRYTNNTCGKGETVLATGLTALNYTDNTAANNTDFWYKVFAVNGCGKSSDGGVCLGPGRDTVVTLTAPTGLTVTPGDTQNALAWSGGSSPYKVYRGTAGCGGSFSLRASGIAVTNYTDTGLTNGQEYCYYVVSSSGTCESAPSACQCGTPTGSCPALSCTSITIGANPVCSGVSQTFTANFTGGTSPFTVQWDFSYDGKAFNVEGSGNPISQALPVGSNTVAARVTDSCGTGAKTCIMQVTATVNANPTVSVTPAGPVAFCAGGSQLLTATPSGGKSPYGYQWRQGGVNIGGATASTYTATAAGSYDCVVTDANGCSGSSNAVSVSVNPNPSADVTPNNPAICPGGNVTLDANPSGGTPGYTYSWSPGGAKTQTINVSPGSTTLYTVTVTDSKGCSVQSSETVTVQTPPSAAFTHDAPKCLGTAVQFTGPDSPGGGGGTLNYSYSPVPATVTKNGTSTFILAVSEAKTVAGGVTAQVTMTAPTRTGSNLTVTLQSPLGTPQQIYSGAATGWASGTFGPFATFDGEATNGNWQLVVVHSGGSGGSSNGTLNAFNLGVNYTGGASWSYAWDFDDSGSTDSTLQSPSYNYPSAKSWTARLTVTDSTTGCTASTAQSVTVDANPSVSISGATEYCAGGGVTLTANPSGGAGGYSYLWSNGATTASVNVTAGSYTVMVTDSKGCVSPASAAHVVSENANPSASISESACIGNDRELTANASGGAGGYSYLWSNGAQTQTITVAAGSGPYTVAVTDSKGCSGASSPFTAGGCATIPEEPSAAPSDPPLEITDQTAGEVVVEEIWNATQYVVYSGALGQWYGDPSGCAAPWASNGDGTVSLDYALADNSWIVVTARNAGGESSAGMASDGSTLTPRKSAGNWTFAGACP